MHYKTEQEQLEEIFDDAEYQMFQAQPPTAREKFFALLKKEPIVDKTISSTKFPF